MLFNSIYKFLDQNEELEKCWLAATNKKAFESLKAEAIEEIAVPNLCSKIWYNFTNRNSTSSLSLLSAAKLMFGAVLIHKSQVDSLFVRTQKLNHHKQFLFFGALGRNDGLKCNTAASNRKTKKDKSVNSIFCWNSTDLLNEVEELENVGETQLLPFEENFQCTHNESISIKETTNAERWNKNFEDEEDFLGQITDLEISFYTGVLARRQSLFDSTNDSNQFFDLMRSQNSNKENMYVEDLNVEVDDLNKTRSSPIHRTINSTAASIPIVDQILPLQPSPDVPLQRSPDVISANIDCDNLDNTSQGRQKSPDIISANIEDLNTSQGRQKSPDIISANIEDLNTSQGRQKSPDIISANIEDLNTSQGRQKRKLIIDREIEYTGDYVKKRLTASDVFRCTNPREDIVLIKCTPAKNLLSNVCLSKNNLFSNFHKKLKRKNESTDINGILSEILGPNISESSEPELFDFSRNSKRRKKNSKKTNNISLENTVDNFNDISISRINESIIPKNLDPLEQNVLRQIIEEFPTEITGEDHITDMENHQALTQKRKIIREFNVLSIIRRLLKLWHRKVHPINTSILFDPDLASKLGAAKGFSSLLELNGKRYIKIIKDDTTHNIIHIEPGEKIHWKSN